MAKINVRNQRKTKDYEIKQFLKFYFKRVHPRGQSFHNSSNQRCQEKIIRNVRRNFEIWLIKISEIYNRSNTITVRRQSERMDQESSQCW